MEKPYPMERGWGIGSTIIPTVRLLMYKAIEKAGVVWQQWWSKSGLARKVSSFSIFHFPFSSIFYFSIFLFFIFYVLFPIFFYFLFLYFSIFYYFLFSIFYFLISIFYFSIVIAVASWYWQTSLLGLVRCLYRSIEKERQRCGLVRKISRYFLFVVVDFPIGTGEILTVATSLGTKLGTYQTLVCWDSSISAWIVTNIQNDFPSTLSCVEYQFRLSKCTRIFHISTW